MAAAQFFMLVERELAVAAPLAASYDASTPRKLAGKLARGAGQDLTL
jgi:hypothetical protein